MAFTNPSEIDGAAGLARILHRPCIVGISYGKVREADVFISSSLPTSSLDERDNALGARETVIHEFGHVLGLNHDNTTMSVMCETNTCGKFAKRSIYGAWVADSESLFPDDAYFASTWYGTSTGSRPDMALSGWYHNGSAIVRRYPQTQTLTRCPGDIVTVYGSHGNKGRIPVTASAPAQASIVLSPTDYVSTADRVVWAGALWGQPGTFYHNSFTFVMPALAVGTYYVGMIVDTGSALAEDNEYNNNSILGVRITIPSGC